MEIGVGVVLPRLLGDRQSGVDRRERAVQIRPHGFKLGEQAVERRRAALVAEREIGRERLLEPDRSRLRVVQLAARPVRVHPAEVGVGLQVALLRQLQAAIPPTTRVAGASPRRLSMTVLKKSALATAATWPSSLARRVDSSMSWRARSNSPRCHSVKREEVRRAHLRVIAEPEQRFPVPFADIVAERPLEDACAPPAGRQAGARRSREPGERRPPPCRALRLSLPEGRPRRPRRPGDARHA